MLARDHDHHVDYPFLSGGRPSSDAFSSGLASDSRNEVRVTDPNELANLLAKKFIARPDVKAIQTSHGYMPVCDRRTEERIPWSRQDLLDHLAKSKTYGHYLLSTDSQVKLFAFDVDLEKVGKWDVDFPNGNPEDTFRMEQFAPREAWLDRAHPARSYMKLQFREVAHALGKTIESELDIPWAAAYSGGKGIHVYGFTGLMPASDARDGALIVLDALGYKPSRGDNFFKHEEYENLSIETFPKQGSLDGKDLGNLMRLPLGRNLKAPSEPTFFMDMTAPMGTLAPLDPVYALTTTSQWKRPGE